MASPNGANGKDKTTGRFLPGHKFGRGNPWGKEVNKLRSMLFRTVKPEDIREVAEKLVSMAKAGNIHAIRELLDRMLGKAVQPLELSDAEATRRVEEMSTDELVRIASGEQLLDRIEEAGGE